jgi:mono/diheme cytochrome c family protein
MSTSTKSLALAGLAAALFVLPSARASETDFQRIQNTIFTPLCASCHSGLFAPHRLRLDARNSYRSLVGMRSAEAPAVQRVKSGDPDASYLVHKIEGHASEGVRMPASAPPLSRQDIDLIRQWIAGGARSNESNGK